MSENKPWKSRDCRELTKEMRALSDEDRFAAIDASPNVIGFGRMTARNQQVANQEAFRRPIKGDDK